MSDTLVPVTEFANNPHAIAIESAIAAGLTIGGDSPEIATILNWLKDNSGVGRTYTNTYLQPSLIHADNIDGNGISFTVVNDQSPEARVYPFLREYPHYEDGMRNISLPVETFSWTTLLSAVVLHEGVHIRDFRSPEHTSRALVLLPDMPTDQVVHLLSEVNAFELEGVLLRNLLGESYSAWFDERVQAAADQVIEDFESDSGNVSIKFCIVDDIRAIVDENIGFVETKTKEYCEEIIMNGILTAGCLAVTDIISTRQNLSPNQIALQKVNVLGDDYKY